MKSREWAIAVRLGVAASALAACTMAVAQGTAGSQPAPVAQPQSAAPVAPPHGPVPSKSETAMEAYGKLNRNNAGYLTWEDVRHLNGFETAFQQADQNRDGRLSPAEFNSAWSMYTGNNP
ncbi:MAG TPA: hypothetical protein VLR71_00805 [Casimicrobiaceae bacterium]|nr:hypothetical protein [Casimicrobiaceae bacterium]